MKALETYIVILSEDAWYLYRGGMYMYMYMYMYLHACTNFTPIKFVHSLIL